MTTTHSTLRSEALLNLMAHKSAEQDEIARLWDTLISNVTVAEFNTIINTIDRVIERI